MSQSKRTLYIIAVSVFVTLGISGGLLNVAWTYMQVSFDVTVGEIGVLLLFATTGSLFAAMASGTFIGKYGNGRVGVAAMMVVALGLFGMAISPTWVILLAVILIMYMGRGMLDGSLNAFVSENYGSTEMNWLHASWGVGLTIAPFVMTFVLINLEMSWRVGYFLMAGVAFLLGLVMLLNIQHWRNTPGEQSESGEIIIKRASALEALREPAVIWSGAFFFVYGGVEIGAGQLLNTLFVEGRDVSQELASLWLSFYWGSFTLGRMLIGVFALRFKDAVLLRMSLVLMLAGASLLTIHAANWMNMLSVILIGSGLAGIFPILISQTPARVGKRFSAQAIGFQVGFAGFGAAILPGIIGYCGEQFGLEFIAYGIFTVAVLTVAVYEILVRQFPIIVKSKKLSHYISSQ